MSLHEVAQADGLVRTDTCKLFWGIYPYSLKMPIPEDFLEERREAISTFWEKCKGQRWSDVQPGMKEIHGAYRKQLQEVIDTVIDKNIVALKADDFYYQSSEKNTTFYVKSAKVAAVLINNNPGVFHTYSAPRSDAVEAHLHEVAGKRIEVRETGWFGEYDHKVIFKWQHNYEALDARVEALKFEESLYSKGCSRILYVLGDDDFFLAKLALSDRIESVTRCVTVEAVEQQQQ
jgi:hypothetical protein